MGQTELPCIVQALPATTAASKDTSIKPEFSKTKSPFCNRLDQTQIPCIVQALPATTSMDKGTPTKRETTNIEAWDPPSKRDSSSVQTPSSSRCTRSQVAPDWTEQELLVLVNAIASMDEDWLKSLSSFQRWKIVSDNCAASDVIRPSNQCKRKWESLMTDYRKIRDWESRPRARSYWFLDREQRNRIGLPSLFYNQVYDSMDAVIKAQEDQTEAKDSDSEGLITASGDVEQMDVDIDSGPEEETQGKTEEIPDKAQEIVSKLRESAQLIHAILRGEMKDDANSCNAPVESAKKDDMAAEVELVRRQAAELIKAFGDLTGNLDQFIDLIKKDGFAGIPSVKSVVS